LATDKEAGVRTSFGRKLLLSLAAVGGAASIASLGTFATFTSSTSASQSVSSGTVSIALGTSGTADNRLTVSASGLVPGDTIQRRVKLANSGTQSLASISLTTSASPSSVLDTDGANGLQMKMERCTTGSWTEAGSGPYTYTCDLVAGTGLDNGTRTTVLAERAVIGTNLSLSNLSALASGSTDDVVVTLRLPASADNTFQNRTSTITYQFDATQRAATSR
jgi:spore coat-associated protein N